jgi:transposase
VLLRLLTDFDREIDALAKEIDRLAKHDPRVEVLTQIRGIGRYIAMLIIAEVGEVERFPSARHLRAWAGLTPTVRSSDGKARLDHISRLGSSTLRWALDGAANTPRVAVDRCARASYGSQNAAGARSRKSPSRASCRRCAATACATARSAARMSRTGVRDERHGALNRGSSATWVRPGPGYPPPSSLRMLGRTRSYVWPPPTGRPPT